MKKKKKEEEKKNGEDKANTALGSCTWACIATSRVEPRSVSVCLVRSPCPYPRPHLSSRLVETCTPTGFAYA